MESRGSKRPYRSPALVVYGDVRALTRQSGGRMGGTDRIAKLPGNGMHCLVQLKTGLDIGGDEEC